MKLIPDEYGEYTVWLLTQEEEGDYTRSVHATEEGARREAEADGFPYFIEPLAMRN